MVNATVCIPKNRGCKKLEKCGIYHLCLRFNPQFLHICMEQICANPFFRPVIDSQTDGKTVCPFKVPKYSQQCIRFFSCSLFYPHVSVFKIIKIAFIFISLFNIRQLSIKAANEIHYCGTYTDPHYQPLPVQSSRYLLLSRDMSTIRK